MRVVLGRGGSGESTLADPAWLPAGGDDQFGPGDRRETNHTATDSVSVTVVHVPTNTVLVREFLDVPDFSTNSDRFRLQVEFASPDVTKSPTFGGENLADTG